MATQTTAKSASKKSPRKPAGKAAGRSASKTSKGMMSQLKTSASKLVGQIESYLPSKATDVVGAVKEDHDSLRNYLGILRDVKKNMTERRRAYVAFAALLKSHTTAEERAVYGGSEELTGHDLHIKVTEGFVEHRLADDLMKRIERTRDPMEWSAHANVLAEIVEHHLKEEEDDLLPLIRRRSTPAENMEMLTKFLALRAKTQTKVSKKNAGALQ